MQLKRLPGLQKLDGKDVTDDNPEGLSHMQKAEALMASMWGVEVVKLDCREVKTFAGEGDFAKMAGWAELMALKP